MYFSDSNRSCYKLNISVLVSFNHGDVVVINYSASIVVHARTKKYEVGCAN